MERKKYVQPELELVTIKVEKGFAASQQEPSPWEDM